MALDILDPLTESFQRDPSPFLANARRQEPLHWIESIGAWYAVSYEVVRELFTHPALTNDIRTWEGYQPPVPGSVQDWSSRTNLFALEAADHARARRLGSHAFTPASVRRMDQRMDEVCREFADTVEAEPGTVVDLAQKYTRPIPNAVISRILGIPPKGEDDLRFRELAAAPLRLANPLVSAEEKAVAEAAATELIAYVGELVAERREEPAEDLVTDLVAAYDADDRLSDDEVVHLVFALLSAGTDTTTFASTYGLRNLVRFPDQLALLRDRPELLGNAVLELLRFELGGGALPRFVRQSTEIAGRSLREGQIVFLSMLGAHRDPAVFAEPDVLDLTRDTRDVMVFGHGPHYCMGANLAKAELAAIYRRALPLLGPSPEVLEDEVRFSPPSPMFSSIESLPIRL